MAGNAAFENGSRLPEPCPPKAGSWCSCYERRPHVRLTVLGNGPRRANGLGPWIPKQLETFRCPRDNPLTKPSSCEVCSAFTRVAACTLARSPYIVTAIRRLQTLRLLHVCSGRFRLERSPGDGLAPTGKAPPCHGAHGRRTFVINCTPHPGALI